MTGHSIPVDLGVAKLQLHFWDTSPYLYSLAIVKPDGKRRILLVNKCDRSFGISIPGVTGGQEDYVDQTTAFDPPASTKLTSETVMRKGLSVAVVTLSLISPDIPCG